MARERIRFAAYGGGPVRGGTPGAGRGGGSGVAARAAPAGVVECCTESLLSWSRIAPGRSPFKFRQPAVTTASVSPLTDSPYGCQVSALWRGKPWEHSDPDHPDPDLTKPRQGVRLLVK
ncbi:hypothetical protein Prubr_36900 [Polymorphospora rubra]|uniref:Uncharacterized protein n=1 Tax=Polymorphospora rubra TaxID=338584 RepID=A0A810N383_9ACTN|nr:hypothetical protein Prubr_36900 [Polymorphospora rubra]